MTKPPMRIDTSVPNVARMYDYYLGGRNNFDADRKAAEHVLRLVPGVRRAVAINRAFLQAAVRYLATEADIDQFLDIGVGLRTEGSVHEVAHEVRPDARTAYVDHDPVVVSHANALLARTRMTIAVSGDLLRPAEMLADPAIRRHLDFGRPIGVILLGILHFVSDDDDPAGIIAALREALAPGSYLAITHLGALLGVEGDHALRIYRGAGQPVFPRTSAELTRLLDGFELIDPPAGLLDPPVITGRGSRPGGPSGGGQQPGGQEVTSRSPTGWRILARLP